MASKRPTGKGAGDPAHSSRRKAANKQRLTKITKREISAVSVASQGHLVDESLLVAALKELLKSENKVKFDVDQVLKSLATCVVQWRENRENNASLSLVECVALADGTSAVAAELQQRIEPMEGRTRAAMDLVLWKSRSELYEHLSSRLQDDLSTLMEALECASKVMSAAI